jgi:hypothetical protein
MILGEKRIKTLSATDTWMILQCAYLHDFGMAILFKKIEEIWQSEEFNEYIEEEKSSYDKDRNEAINYIWGLKDNLQKKDFEKIWPLKIRKHVTRLIADFFRSKHSNLTKEYLNILLDEWQIDLSHNNLIKNRLLKSIAEISFLHTQDFNKILKLDYESNGFKSDYIHPRFIAEMLRLGDLLDLDNGRFNDYVEKVIGEIPEVSQIHKEKHRSTNHVLITPERVEVSADCINEDTYRATKDWFVWLRKEIEQLTINWVDIVPKNLSGYAPKLTKEETLINGKKDLNGIMDLKFEISQEKAFEIIEGSSIYEDKYVFLREFIQNALDASKIQLWRDLKNGLYDSWVTVPLDKL